jgi:teichuronic acid biosynthesis glycosyltransferase TuaH
VSSAEPRQAPARAHPGSVACELVVCSLEPWDDVWRRNQFLADALLRRSGALRVLFVEPPADILFELVQRRRPTMPSIRSLRTDGRLHALRPLKPLPRRFGPLSDRALQRRVIDAAQRLGFTRPTLWLNDVTYAPLISRTGWPTLYDVTDDWLLAPLPEREIDRLRSLDAMALANAHEVVVCSPALAASRGAGRRVTLVANGVDHEHFRRPRPRPDDLPRAPTAVYVGTLHESRLDIELVIELARTLTTLSVVLVGPDALQQAARRSLSAEPNVHLLGSRPYTDVPAYLQHADVVIVPHRVTPFTESLDPIKAYECLAVDTPTVATPIAGFRELGGCITVAPRESFVEAVRVPARTVPSRRPDPAKRGGSWEERACAFELVLTRAVESASWSGQAST